MSGGVGTAGAMPTGGAVATGGVGGGAAGNGGVQPTAGSGGAAAGGRAGSGGVFGLGGFSGISGIGGFGGLGGIGGNGVCDLIAAAYQAAVQSAKMCLTSLNRLTCQTVADSDLRCHCQTYVDSNALLKPIAAQWTASGCTGGCVLDCAPLPTGGGHCVATGGAATGTCQNGP
jgi:hypothetical protein